MVSWRGFLKSLSALTALPAASGMAQWDFERTKALMLAFPASNDPAYWRKIRGMSMIPEGKAFFNTGTLGA